MLNHRQFRDDLISRHLKLNGDVEPPRTDDFITGFVQWINSLNVREHITVEEVIELLMDTESPTVEEIIYELERNDDDVH